MRSCEPWSALSVGVGIDDVKPDEHSNTHEIVDHWYPRRRAEAVSHVEQGGGNPNDAIKEDLGYEPAQQRCRDETLFMQRRKRTLCRRMLQESEAVDDPRCGKPRKSTGEYEHDERTGNDA